MHHRRAPLGASRCVLLASFVACAGTVASGDGPYDFTINSALSGLNGSATNSVTTTGTLIGNWDPDTNPTGTRTKSGINIFSPFPSTLNEAVNIDLGLGLNGSLNTQSAGGFSMNINTGAGLLDLSGFSIDFLSSGPASLPFSISLDSPGFQTRNPTFLYPPGDITIPVGEASLTSFSATQVGGGIGGLTPTGTPGEFSFVAVPLVDLMLSVDFLGNAFDLPAGVAVPLPLAGTLVLDGASASITSLQPIEFGDMFEPDFALPEFPLALPTLNPDSPANVLLSLNLSQIAFGFDGDLSLVAEGVLVPAPGAGVVLGACCLGLVRRRR